MARGLGRRPRRLGIRRSVHRRLPRRSQPAGLSVGRVHDAHGAGRADARRDARAEARIVSRQRLAARADPAPRRARRAIRVGLPGAAARRRGRARRPVGSRGRLHRSARLGRGLHPRRGLDRSRPDVGLARRRGPSAARLLTASVERGADHRRDRPVRSHVRILEHRHSPRRPAPRDVAVFRRAMDAHRRTRSRGRQGARGRRRAPDRRRRTDLRLDRRHGRRRVDHRGRRRGQAGARRGPRAAPARPFRAGRPRPLRAGPVVSRRAAAALADRALVAGRRRAAVERPRAARRPACSPRPPAPRPRPPAPPKPPAPPPKPSPARSRRRSVCPTAAASLRTKIRCTDSWSRPACREAIHRPSTSIPPMRPCETAPIGCASSPPSTRSAGASPPVGSSRCTPCRRDQTRDHRTGPAGPRHAGPCGAADSR